MRNPLAVCLAALTVTLLASGASAEMYKWVDKDGNVSYSDTPPPKEAKNVTQKKFGDSVSGPSDSLPYEIRDAARKNPVILYATSCGELCDSARALLNARGIPFTERNPEKDPSAQDALKKATGATSVPILVVGEDVMRGYSEPAWNGALTQAGYPKSYSPPSKPTDSPPSAKAPKQDETATPPTPPAPKKKK